ncbi:hypothetical protein KI387_030872, partial [Taxus chinensis]
AEAPRYFQRHGIVNDAVLDNGERGGKWSVSEHYRPQRRQGRVWCGHAGLQGEAGCHVCRVQDLRPADHRHGGSENPRRRHYYWSHSVRCPGSIASTMPWVRCFHDALDSLPPRLHKKIRRYVSFTELIPAFHINPSRGMTFNMSIKGTNLI